jgi:hypothetical protein
MRRGAEIAVYAIRCSKFPTSTYTAEWFAHRCVVGRVSYMYEYVSDSRFVHPGCDECVTTVTTFWQT